MQMQSDKIYIGSTEKSISGHEKSREYAKEEVKVTEKHPKDLKAWYNEGSQNRVFSGGTQ